MAGNHSQYLTVTEEALEAAKRGLDGLPKKPDRLRPNEVITVLKPAIDAAIKKGYDYAEIASMLKQSHSIAITVSALTNYYKKLRTKSKVSTSQVGSPKTKSPMVKVPAKSPEKSSEKATAFSTAPATH